MTPTEDELFERYRATRDVDALADLYDMTAAKLLRVALHLVRQPAEAEDLVQATFVAAIERADAYERGRPVLAWLLGILKHKAHALWKRAGRTLEHGPSAREPEPDPLAAAESGELTALVDEAIAALPEPYQPVLRLHLGQKLTAAEIAHALARPPGTVRTQIVRGLEILRSALPAGVATALLALLTPARGLAAVRAEVLAGAHAAQAALASAGAAAGTLTGARLATRKGILLACGGLAVVAGTLWWASAGQRHGAAASLGQLGAPGPASAPSAETTPSVQEPARQAVVAPALGAVTPGSVRVRVLREGDRSPVPGVRAYCIAWEGDNPRTFPFRGTTDAEGQLCWEGVPPGKPSIYLDRGRGGSVLVEGGKRAEVTLLIPAALEVRGRVVDASGAPIADADVELPSVSRDRELYPVARTDSSGRFCVHDVTFGRGVASVEAGLIASAPGYARTWPPVPVHGKPGETVEVTIRLETGGGSVHGTVRGPDGRPLANAALRVRDEVPHYPHRPAAAFVQADAQGTFVVTGLLPGRFLVQARGRETGTATRVVDVVAGETRPVDLSVPAEAVVCGHVRDEQGRPVAGAEVGVGNVHEDFEHCLTRSRADGSFRLHGLTAGEVRLWGQLGDDDKSSKGTCLVNASAGRAVPADLVLAPPPPETWLRGRVLDAHGEPLVGWRLFFNPPDSMTSSFSARATSDARGAFAVAGAPETVEVQLWAPVDDGAPVLLEPKAHPGGAELVLRVPNELVTPVTVALRLVDEQQMPIEEAFVTFEPLGLARGSNGPTAMVLSRLPGGRHSITLPARRYTLTVAAPGRAEKRITDVELRAGAPRDLGTICLPLVRECVVKIEEEGGKPASRDTRWSLRETGATEVASGQGARVAMPLAAGSYWFEWADGAGRGASGPIRVGGARPDGKAQEFRFVIR